MTNLLKYCVPWRQVANAENLRNVFPSDAILAISNENNEQNVIILDISPVHLTLPECCLLREQN